MNEFDILKKIVFFRINLQFFFAWMHSPHFVPIEHEQTSFCDCKDLQPSQVIHEHSTLLRNLTVSSVDHPNKILLPRWHLVGMEECIDGIGWSMGGVVLHSVYPWCASCDRACLILTFLYSKQINLIHSLPSWLLLACILGVLPVVWNLSFFDFPSITIGIIFS